MLSKLVREIVATQPSGLKHVEVVKELLRRGYKHQGKQSLSEAVYEVLKNLVLSGTICRTQNEFMERRYKTKTMV